MLWTNPFVPLNYPPSRGKEQKTMPMEDLYLWMPDLWGTGAVSPLAEAMPMVKALWPGLPISTAAKDEMDRFPQGWTPAELPVSTRDMGAFLRDMEVYSAEAARGDGGLSGLFMARMKAEAEASLRREMAEVAALADDKARGQVETTQSRTRAQRLLAWFWFQQKNLAEITALVARINDNVQGLGGDLSKDTPETPELQAGVIPLMTDLTPDVEELAGDWRKWLEAALVFTTGNEVFVCRALSGLPLEQALSDVPLWGEALVPPSGVKICFLEVAAKDLLPRVMLAETNRMLRLAVLMPEQPAAQALDKTPEMDA